MVKIKKLLVLALVGMLALCVLAGCGELGTSSTSSEKATKDSDQAQQILVLLNAERRPEKDQLVNTYGNLAEQVLNSFSTKKEEGKEGAELYLSSGGVLIPTGYTTIGVYTYSLPWSIEVSMDYDTGMTIYREILKKRGASMVGRDVGVATRVINGKVYFVAIIEIS